MSQHPDTEAAEKYADSMTLGPKNAHTKPWARARADGFRAGATHVRASLAPELEKLKMLLRRITVTDSVLLTERQMVDANAHIAREALEILSRLMGKGEV